MTIQEAKEQFKDDPDYSLDIKMSEELFNLKVIRHDFWTEYPEHNKGKQYKLRQKIWEYAFWTITHP